MTGYKPPIRDGRDSGATMVENMPGSDTTEDITALIEKSHPDREQ